MSDPFAQVVTLLQPRAPYFKLAAAAGHWTVRRAEAGRPFFCLVLEGECRLAAGGAEAVVLRQDDFVLIPAAQEFTVGGGDEAAGNDPDAVVVRAEETRHGRPDGPPEVRLLVGYCSFASPDADLLVPLLPQLVHVRGDARLTAIVQLVGDEYRQQRPARGVILERLLEVLLIEALRSAASSAASPGLMRGLADERLAAALRCLHAQPQRAWTVAGLAREAALSRSAFFERFQRAVGLAPMAYLLSWRMALAKDLLARGRNVAQVAESVGYGSASAFSVAFARHAGMPPSRFVQQAGAGAQ